jgi:hypothetical protein
VPTSTHEGSRVTEWISSNRVLLLVVVLGAVVSLAIVPYHRATARAECHRLYQRAVTWADTLQVDQVTVDRWDRFPGLVIRCEVIRREVRKPEQQLSP